MLKKLNNSMIFEELYCLVLMLISFLFYCVSPIAGMIIILIIAIMSLIIFKDFKYMIPCVLYFIFSNSSNFDKAILPIPLFICGIGLIATLIIFMIKNKFKFSNIKSCKGILLLGIINLFPILWHNIIKDGEEVLYLLYLGYLFYFLIYFIFAGSIKKDSLNMLIKTFTYLGVLISLECLINVVNLHIQNPNQNIFNFWYYIGWGLCNEAGIMMCVCLPFVFISLSKADKLYKVIISLLNISIISCGMYLTTSRGTLVFGMIELLTLLIYTLFSSKKRILLIVIYLVALVSGVFIIHILFDITTILKDIKTHVFNLGLSDNGRFDFWKQSLNLWKTDFVRMTFGSGVIAEYYPDGTRYVVYHSTIFQILATVGNLGLAFIIIHFIEKYKQLKVLGNSNMGILLIGYIVVDLYGLIDNTYGMYYYMIPMMIIMAVLDAKANSINNTVF